MAAHVALDHCAPADAIHIASDTLSRLGAGSPLPVPLRATDEAVSWTQIATPVEIKAWAPACFEAMPPRTQTAFLDFIAGRVRQ